MTTSQKGRAFSAARSPIDRAEDALERAEARYSKACDAADKAFERARQAGQGYRSIHRDRWEQAEQRRMAAREALDAALDELDDVIRWEQGTRPC